MEQANTHSLIDFNVPQDTDTSTKNSYSRQVILLKTKRNDKYPTGGVLLTAHHKIL